MWVLYQRREENLRRLDLLFQELGQLRVEDEKFSKCCLGVRKVLGEYQALIEDHDKIAYGPLECYRVLTSERGETPTIPRELISSLEPTTPLFILLKKICHDTEKTKMECERLAKTNKLFEIERERSDRKLLRYESKRKDDPSDGISRLILDLPREKSICVYQRSLMLQCLNDHIDVTVHESNATIKISVDLSKVKHILRKFFSVVRDQQEYGKYGLKGYEGNQDQLNACLEKLMVDVVKCVLDITRRSDEPQMYALWYRQVGCELPVDVRSEGGKANVTEYQRYVTLVACHSIVHSDMWMDVDRYFPADLIESTAD